MYTSEKNTKQLTVRGGGSTLTVSLTVKYPLFFLTTSLIFQRFLLTAFISILCSLSLLFKVRVGPPGASGPPDNWHFLRTRRPDFLNRHASVSLAKSQSSEYMSMLVPIFLSLYYPSIHVKYLDPTALLI